MYNDLNTHFFLNDEHALHFLIQINFDSLSGWQEDDKSSFA